jgi:hypothetical protein
MVLLQLGKEITSSSPEIGGSGDSSLSNGHSSLSDIINDWKRELEEKNAELRHKSAMNNSLEERLQEKEMELCEMRSECKAVQTERDKNCQMVSELIPYEKNHIRERCFKIVIFYATQLRESIFKIIFLLSLLFDATALRFSLSLCSLIHKL